jgi:mRNA interferase RelE/StbE
MNIEISKSFVKDTQKITDKRILAKIQQILIEAKQIESVTDWANVEALTGYQGFYRIRFDYRYRIGIYCEKETIQFLRVGSRESFYKKFP